MIAEDCNDCRNTVAGCPAHREERPSAASVLRAIIAGSPEEEEPEEEEPEDGGQA